MRLVSPSVRAAFRPLAHPLALLAVVLAGALAWYAASTAAPRRTGAGNMGGMAMAMDWYASHPRVGRMAATVLPPAAIFVVENFTFENDGNPATQVDSVTIQVGQVVTWSWLSGIHTITNGVDDLDPNAGLLFDQPSQSTFTTFSYQFNSPGRYPFFCRYHGSLYNMKGVVNVTAPVPTQRTSWGEVKRRYAH